MQTMLAVVRQDVFERESVRVLRNALLTQWNNLGGVP
jgi:hypothetical protein